MLTYIYNISSYAFYTSGTLHSHITLIQILGFGYGDYSDWHTSLFVGAETLSAHRLLWQPPN